MKYWIILWLVGTSFLMGCSLRATPTSQPEKPIVSLPIIESAATVHPSLLTPETPASDTSTLPVSTTVPQPDLTICSIPAPLTPPLTEGPYFMSGSPERTSLLEPGLPGTKLTLTGYVLTADCQPVSNALLEFWQADANGVYDNTGYSLRGHQFTDESGKYTLETVIPGIYTGRTEHIHVKVQAPDGPVLTTQLFFPNVPENQSDRIFDSSLVLSLEQVGDGHVAEFNFIISLR